MPIITPAGAAPVTGLLKAGAPVLTHTIRGIVKRVRVSADGEEVQYLVGYSDAVTGEPQERFFQAADLFVPAPSQEPA